MCPEGGLCHRIRLALPGGPDAGQYGRASLSWLLTSLARRSIQSCSNNYSVKYAGGEALGQFAHQRWHDHVDRVLLLEMPDAGPTPHSRVLGTLHGIQSVVPKLPEKCVLHRNSKRTEAGGYQVTRRVLPSLAPRLRLLFAAPNDDSARGAIRAVRQAGRQTFTAIMAQGWGPDELLEAELRDTNSPLIGAVAHFPERYGSRIIPIILQFLNGQPVPPAPYTEHKLFLRDGFRLQDEEQTPTFENLKYA